MRVFLAAGLLGWFGLTGAVLATRVKTAVMDDFTSANPTKAWQVRQVATISYEKNGLRLKMAQYSGQQGEDKWPGMERSAGNLPIALYNGLLIDLTNPTDHSQGLQVGFADGRPGGAEMLTRVGPHEHRVVKVYFDKMISGIVDWSHITSISLTRTTPSTPQVWVFHRISMFCDDPATTETGELRGMLASARQVFEQAKSAGALSGKAVVRDEAAIEKWSEAVRSVKGIWGKGDACRNELRALESQSRLALLGKKLNKPVVLWSVPLGTRFEPAAAMTQYQKPAEKLELYAARGEYQDGIVRVTNLSDTTQDWKVSIDSKEPAVAAALSVRRNQAVLAADHSVVGDVLTPLDGAGVVSVAPGETAELWIAADVKHHDWKSGKHEAELSLKDLRRGDASVVTLPLEITVRNFNVADAPAMHLNLWSYLYYMHAKPIEGREEAALSNLRDYGCDVFVLNSWQMPMPNLDAEGEPKAPMDFTFFDKLVKFYRSKGKVMLLVDLDLQYTAPAFMGLHAGLKTYSPAWDKGVRYWIGQFMRRMQTLSVPTSDYAFYITDEPNRAELDVTRAVAKIAKSIDPSVQIYMDSSQLYDDSNLNDDLMKLVSINQVRGDDMDANPSLLPELKKYSNLKLWVYQCRTEVRSSQLVNAYDYYRLLAWQAQRDGMNGIGYWIYCYNSAKDLWDGTSGTSGSLVYPDSDKGILMSPRWELIRTSLDDVKYYRLLEKAGKSPATEALLGKRFDAVIAHPHDPALAVQWRIDAGAALETAGK